MLSEQDFAILNTIHLKKMATADAVAQATGLPAQDVQQRLAAAAAAGWLLEMPTGSMLLEDGTREVLQTYREAYAQARGEPVVLAWYEAFEALNSRFIAQVTEWQQTEGDPRAERRLLQSAGRLARDLNALLAHVPRYGAYVARLERAMEQVDQGRIEFVCKPTVDSVHNIWFEFHEDILAVLGRPRDTT